MTLYIVESARRKQILETAIGRQEDIKVVSYSAVSYRGYRPKKVYLDANLIKFYDEICDYFGEDKVYVYDYWRIVENYDKGVSYGYETRD